MKLRAHTWPARNYHRGSKLQVPKKQSVPTLVIKKTLAKRQDVEDLHI